MTILVIEDEQDIRENIIETLQLSGYDVQGAHNGVVGVELARQIKPELILCDVMMDGLDGYGVLETLRRDANTAALPFIFLTAKADRQSMRQGMGLGADDYITKPFNATELLEAVESRLLRHQSIAQKAEQHFEGARQQVVEMIAQQMQRPLESLSTVLDIISRQLSYLSPEDMQELLDTASYGSRRLRRLIDQLALIARLDTGLLTGETIARGGVRLPLRDVWTIAMDRARGIVPDRLDVEVHLDGDNQPALVVCEEAALQQALAELIANALTNARPNGSVTLTQWIEGDTVWFTVSDNGAGISPQITQALMAGDPNVPGLGLKLAKRIVEAHGGELSIHSIRNEGTTVAVHLPAAGA